MLKIIAVGRLTHSLEIIQTSNINQKVSNFTLACRSGKETELIRCTAWNEVAKTIQSYTTKGSMLYIEGQYKTKEYVDETTNLKHQRIFLLVEKFEFLEAQRKEDKLPLD